VFHWWENNWRTQASWRAAAPQGIDQPYGRLETVLAADASGLEADPAAFPQIGHRAERLK